VSGQTLLRPVAEVGSLDPPPALEHNVVWPGGHVLLYGYGGHGKSAVASWVAAQHTRSGQVVAWLDYENNPDEVRARHAGFGGDESLLYIASPEPLGRLSGPVWRQAEDIRDALAEVGASLAIIDSVVPAAQVSADAIGSAEHPIGYRHALDVFGISTLSIGHASGEPSERRLGKPWGSNFWVNAMRLTWSLWHDEARGVLRVSMVKKNRHRQRQYEVEWGWAQELEDGVTPPDLSWAETSKPGPAARSEPDRDADDDARLLATLAKHAPNEQNAANTTQICRLSGIAQQRANAALLRIASRVGPVDRAGSRKEGRGVAYWFVPGHASAAAAPGTAGPSGGDQ
jgi:hypothetical protein